MRSDFSLNYNIHTLFPRLKVPNRKLMPRNFRWHPAWRVRVVHSSPYRPHSVGENAFGPANNCGSYTFVFHSRFFLIFQRCEGRFRSKLETGFLSFPNTLLCTVLAVCIARCSIVRPCSVYTTINSQRYVRLALTTSLSV